MNDPHGRLTATNSQAYVDDEIAQRILRIGELAASRVDAASLQRFRADVERQRRLVGDQPYYREWLGIIDAGAAAVRAVLSARTERGRYMRSVVPLRAFVSRSERDLVFGRVQAPRTNA